MLRHHKNHGSMLRCLWITWEKQRRNAGVSNGLSCLLEEIIFEKPRFIRYVRSIIATIAILAEKNPRVIVAQNPSIILALMAILLKPIFRFKVIIDAHNAGIFPLEGSSQALMVLARFLTRKADLTLVTNEDLLAVVLKRGGRGFVLPDRIPEVPPMSSPLGLQEKHTIAYICTFSNDEPYDAVFEAARYIPPDCQIYVTGKYGNKIKKEQLPANVTLLGFLSDSEYWMLLTEVDIVMDLTTRENCLVCGAYEGLAVGKPMILSDTKVTRQYFSEGCLYVQPNVSAIAYGIIEAVKRSSSLKRDVATMKTRLEADWFDRIESLKNRIILAAVER